MVGPFGVEKITQKSALTYWNFHHDNPPQHGLLDMPRDSMPHKAGGATGLRLATGNPEVVFTMMTGHERNRAGLDLLLHPAQREPVPLFFLPHLCTYPRLEHFILDLAPAMFATSTPVADLSRHLGSHRDNSVSAFWRFFILHLILPMWVLRERHKVPKAAGGEKRQ